MGAPRVSIVLPAFNAAATIAEAVRSMRAQTYPDWELIVVDDGSADGTREVVRESGRGDLRIRPVEQSHSGLVSALNAGLVAARGCLIARMDADDVSHPERLAEQVAFLDGQRDIGVVGSLVRFGGDPVRAAGYARHVAWLNSVVSPEAIALERFVESPLAHPSVTFRRELVDQHGGYCSGDFPEDYEMWLRWLEAGVKIGKVARLLLTWNDPPRRLSRQDSRYEAASFYRCKAAFLARWIARNVEPSRALLIWGAGRLTRRRVDYLLACGVQISGYIDIDPRKIGRRFGLHQVIGPADLPLPHRCFVIGYVGKQGARELVRARLCSKGFVEGRDFLMAA